MTASSRSTKIEQLHKSLRKHYKPLGSTPERGVFDHLIYACLAEDAPYEAAEEAFVKLQQSAADYNDLRVTTVTELMEHLRVLPAPREAASRIKRNLQSIFDSRYAFELEDLKKANMAKAAETLAAMKGMTRFVHNYVCQNALGSHTIPLDASSLRAAERLELITAAEASKESIPGLERAIAKNKGLEFSELIHQFGVDLAQHPDSPEVAAVFKEMKVAYEPERKQVIDEPTPPSKSSSKSGGKAKAAPADADPKPNKQATTQAADAAADNKKTAAKTGAKPPAVAKPSAAAAPAPAKKGEAADKPEGDSQTTSKAKTAGDKSPPKKTAKKPDDAVAKASPKSAGSSKTSPAKKPAAAKTASGRSLTKKKPK